MRRFRKLSKQATTQQEHSSRYVGLEQPKGPYGVFTAAGERIGGNYSNRSIAKMDADKIGGIVKDLNEKPL